MTNPLAMNVATRNGLRAGDTLALKNRDGVITATIKRTERSWAEDVAEAYNTRMRECRPDLYDDGSRWMPNKAGDGVFLTKNEEVLRRQVIEDRAKTERIRREENRFAGLRATPTQGENP